MSKLFKILCLVLLISISTSCAKNHIEELKKSPELIVDGSKSVALISKDEIILYEYDREFDKNFKNKKEYANYFTKSFETQLVSNHLYKNVAILDNSAIETIFDTTDYDYIISIEDVKIIAFFESSQNNSYAVNLGNTQKKKSTVRCRIKVYDKIIKKPIAEFYAIGESVYSEKNYKSVVEKASVKAIENTIEYLKTGKTKF